MGLQSKGVDGRGWLITGGLLMIVGAIVIFVWPSLAIGTIVVITGIILIILGFSEIVGALQVRKLALGRLTGTLAHAPTTPSGPPGGVVPAPWRA